LLKLLAQLTVVGDVSRDAFVSRVRDMAAGPEHVLVVLGARRVHARICAHTRTVFLITLFCVVRALPLSLCR
jgi:hypothetical protein